MGPRAADTYGKLNIVTIITTHYYSNYLYKNPEIDSDNTAFEQLIDIVDSDIFDNCRD